MRRIPKFGSKPFSLSTPHCLTGDMIEFSPINVGLSEWPNKEGRFLRGQGSQQSHGCLCRLD